MFAAPVTKGPAPFFVTREGVAVADTNTLSLAVVVALVEFLPPLLPPVAVARAVWLSDLRTVDDTDGSALNERVLVVKAGVDSCGRLGLCSGMWRVYTCLCGNKRCESQQYECPELHFGENSPCVEAWV